MYHPAIIEDKSFPPLPNGTYQGTWSGHEASLNQTPDGRIYRFKTAVAVKGINVKCRIHITNNAAEVEVA